MTKLNLKIITPEKIIFEGEIDELLVETNKGQTGILPHHINLMTKIIPGELQIKDNGKTTIMATGAGLLQVTDNQVSILTDLAQEAGDISEKEVEEARSRAQAALAQTLTEEEYADTLGALERSLAQLKVKRRHQVR